MLTGCFSAGLTQKIRDAERQSSVQKDTLRISLPAGQMVRMCPQIGERLYRIDSVGGTWWLLIPENDSQVAALFDKDPLTTYELHARFVFYWENSMWQPPLSSGPLAPGDSGQPLKLTFSAKASAYVPEEIAKSPLDAMLVQNVPPSPGSTSFAVHNGSTSLVFRQRGSVRWVPVYVFAPHSREKTLDAKVRKMKSFYVLTIPMDIVTFPVQSLWMIGHVFFQLGPVLNYRG